MATPKVVDKLTVDEMWLELRKPFPKGTVGKLPKPYSSTSQKGKCAECGGWHGLPAVHLDYIGHAAVTDRLNSVVTPAGWNLEPVAFDGAGNPVVNSHGELWCRLTILETSKICVGDGSTSAKILIGDALRNGAMRFGIGLDLWSKEELESHLEQPDLKNDKPTAAPATDEYVPPEPSRDIADEPISLESRGKLKAAIVTSGRFKSPKEVAEFCQFILDKDEPTTERDVEDLIKALN